MLGNDDGIAVNVVALFVPWKDNGVNSLAMLRMTSIGFSG